MVPPMLQAEAAFQTWDEFNISPAMTRLPAGAEVDALNLKRDLPRRRDRVNAGRPKVRLRVVNTGDRPSRSAAIPFRHHAALDFDRVPPPFRLALDIAAGDRRALRRAV